MPRGRPRKSRGGGRGRGRGRGGSNDSSSNLGREIAYIISRIRSPPEPDSTDLITVFESGQEDSSAESPQKFTPGPFTEQRRRLEKEKLKAIAELKKLDNGTHPKLKKLDDALASQVACIQRWSLGERQLIEKEINDKMHMIHSKYESDCEALKEKLIEELEQERNQFKKAWSMVMKKANISKWESDYIEFMVPERSLRSHKSSCSQSTNENSENSIIPVIPEEELGLINLPLPQKDENKEVSFEFTSEEIMEGMAALTVLKS